MTTQNAAAPVPDPSVAQRASEMPRVESAPAPTAKAVGPVRRCGWIQNPTPANWWLVDRDGEWILSAQGGHQAEGMEDMPDLSAGDWVETNGHYGYGCACITLEADPATRQVRRIVKAAPRPLNQCRADRSLPRP